MKFVSLDKLIESSDIISIHVPLNETTKFMINADRIALMKSDSILINTSRGNVVDINALCNALASKKIRGAALDVYEKEPPLNSDHIVFKTPNLLLLPHIGYATEEAIKLRGQIAFDNIYNWMNSIQ